MSCYIIPLIKFKNHYIFTIKVRYRRIRKAVTPSYTKTLTKQRNKLKFQG